MTSADRPALGILCLCAGVLLISFNDVMFKLLSDGYALHQLVAIRAAFGLALMLVLLRREGGLKALKRRRPGLLIFRGLLLVAANFFFFLAIAAMPLAQVTAIFFIAPLLITLLSMPVLGEKIGAVRLSAVVVGFIGVLIMQRPWAEDLEASRLVLVLPVIAAVFYAGMQVMTRKLGVQAGAAVMAIYTQICFLVVSLGFFAIAGDGRFVSEASAPSLQFMLRAWVVPPWEDWGILAAIGVISGIMAYLMTQAYRLADAGVLAPFEYVGLPLAIFWGWRVFGEWPDAATWTGCVLILGAGLIVILRERYLGRRADLRRGVGVRR